MTGKYVKALQDYRLRCERLNHMTEGEKADLADKWRPGRFAELMSNPTELLDALIDADAEHDFLCDLVPALMLPEPVDVDPILRRWIDYLIKREEALGRFLKWESE